MNDSGTARNDSARQDGVTDLSARMARLERSNSRLKFGLVGASMLVVGMALGGFALNDDPIIAYTTSDDTMYRVFKSGKMQYLRLENDPPHTTAGLFNWGEIRIDKSMNLTHKP